MGDISDPVVAAEGEVGVGTEIMAELAERRAVFHADPFWLLAVVTGAAGGDKVVDQG